MKNAVEPLTTGFIGAGAMASWAVYPALHFAPIHLQAVRDLDEGRARAVAGQFGTGTMTQILGSFCSGRDCLIFERT